jgi:hypothetical protein
MIMMAQPTFVGAMQSSMLYRVMLQNNAMPNSTLSYQHVYVQCNSWLV